MKILVCGDRNWTNKKAIRRELKRFGDNYIPQIGGFVVIHGAAKGADTIAGEVAKELGYKVQVFLAQWARYGKGAGPVRNLKMLKKGKPDQVLAFHENITMSRGTKHMIELAKSESVPVKIFKK